MLLLKDRVKEITTTTGTGTVTLVSASTGFQRFSAALSNGDITYYCIESGTQWEVGKGTYSSNTLTRDTVLASSNSGSLIDITAARSFVFITYPASKAVYENTSDETVVSTGIRFPDGTLQTTAAGGDIGYGSISGVPAGTLLGNTSGSVADASGVSSSGVRTFLGLSTSDSPTFSGATLTSHLLFSPTNTKDVGDGVYDPRTVRAATSFIGPNTGDTGPWLRGGMSHSGIGVQDDTTSIWRYGTRVFGVNGAGVCAYNVTPIGLSRTQTPQVYLYCEGDYIIGLTRPDGVTYGTLHTAVVNHPSAALALSNSTYGVTVNGDLRLSQGYGLSLDSTAFSSFLVKGSGSSGTRLVATTGTPVSFEIGAGSVVGRFAGATGNLLVGTTTDDATNKLQVSGGISATSVDRPTAALTLGNSTYGVTVPGSLFTGGTDYSRVNIEPYSTTYSSVRFNSYLNAGSWTTGATGYGAALLFERSSGGLAIQTTIGSQTGGVANALSDRLTIGHGSPAAVTVSTSAYLVFAGTNTPYIQQSGGYLYTGLNSNAVTRVGTDGLVVTGDISMLKTSAQGRVYAFNTTGAHSTSIYNDGTNGIISSTNAGGALLLSPTSNIVEVYRAGQGMQFNVYGASGGTITMQGSGGTGGGPVLTSNVYLTIKGTNDLTLAPSNGATQCYLSGTNSTFDVYSSGTKYTRITHDNTNGIVSTSSGPLRLTSAGTGFEFRPAAGYIEQWTSGSDGQYRIYNAAGSKFLRLEYDTALNRARIAADKICLDAGNTAGVVSIGQNGNSADPGLKRGGVNILSARSGDDTLDSAFTCAGITASGAVLQNAEVTNTPSGTTQTITLSSGNYQTLTLASSTGDVTVTLTVPATSGGGEILIVQHAGTARDITWAASSGSIVWLGTEPTWNADSLSSVRNVRWRFNGTNTYLTASGSS